MQIALVETANTDNIKIINDGNYRITLPDGSQVSPVYAPWEGVNYRFCEIDFDTPIPSYLAQVNISNTGVGYVANNILTISGGTSVGNVAQVEVYTVGSNGIVTSAVVANSGFYNVNPDSPNAPTGGNGTGVGLHLNMDTYPISNRTYVYDANTNTVTETNTYQAPTINNEGSIESQRQTSLEADTGHQNLKDKLRTATSAQIDTWLTNNVTNLAEARQVLGAIVKFLATKFAKGA